MWNNARLTQLSQLSYLLSHYPILFDKRDKAMIMHTFSSTIYIYSSVIYMFFKNIDVLYIVEEFIIILLAIIILFYEYKKSI